MVGNYVYLLGGLLELCCSMICYLNELVYRMAQIRSSSPKSQIQQNTIRIQVTLKKITLNDVCRCVLLGGVGIMHVNEVTEKARRGS